LNTEKTHLIDLNIDESKFNVGMTIKSVDKSKLKRYFDMIVDSMIFLIENYSATIHIFPHVTTDNADREVSFQIYNAIDDKYKSQIRIYTGNYSARELKKLYSLMDIFIGTRLHSAIFAMGELVPSICISYHGTKALGIYRNFGLEEYVVIDYSSQSLISKINNLVYRKSELKNTLRAMIDRQKLEFIDSVKKLF